MHTVAAFSTKEFRQTISKNGAPWDLSAATVSWVARRPDGTYLTRAATIVAPASGVVSYVAADDELTPGVWSYRWFVTDGPVEDCTDEEAMLVAP